MTTLRQTLEQARDALKAHCGGRCNAEYNPCADLEIADSLTAALAQLDEAPGVEQAPSNQQDNRFYREKSTEQTHSTELPGMWDTSDFTGGATDMPAPSTAGERKYISPVHTVADLINNLMLMDQTLPIYGAQYIEHAGKRRCIAVSPTVSRERIKDSRWIGEGDALNAAVIWTRAAQPAQGERAETVQWRNINKVVRAAADWAFGSKDDPEYGHCWLAIVNSLTASDGLDIQALKLDPLPATLSAQALLVPFQERVNPWLLACFGQEIADDTQERNHRFLEESLELVQACGCTPSEAHQLVDYVYGRPVGEKTQEVGGVMVTLAALCLAQRIDMHQSGETELARIWTKVEKIRAKQSAKPKHSPLPEHVVALPVRELTDDQIQEIYIRTYNIGHHGRNFENAFARAIEAHHGITKKATKEPQS